MKNRPEFQGNEIRAEVRKFGHSARLSSNSGLARIRAGVGALSDREQLRIASSEDF